MNRRSFFGFLAAAPVAIPLAAAAASAVPALPAGVFKGPKMTPEQREEFRRIFLRPLDADLLVSRQFEIEEICRFFAAARPPIR